MNLQQAAWSANVILVDADYVDRVAFDLIVNFERMIGRRIPQADLPRWLDCVALDGGLRPGAGKNDVQVVLIHSKRRLENFLPGDFATELDGKAFADQLGEFVIASYQTEGLADTGDFFVEALELACAQPAVKRLMVVPDAEHIYDKVRATLRRADDEKRVTVFAMQPMAGGPFRQEILGYSLMSALGISAEEIREE